MSAKIQNDHRHKAPTERENDKETRKTTTKTQNDQKEKQNHEEM